MERIPFKPIICGTEITIVIVILFLVSVTGSFALQPPTSGDNTSRINFADQPVDPNEGFASSRRPSAEKPASEKGNAKPEAVSDARTGNSQRPVTLDEMPDWQLIHSSVLPFGDYFVDTRVVGAVRYHADFSLETEYDILRELSCIQKDLGQYLAIPHPRETIEVFIFQSKDAYLKFLAKEYPQAPFGRNALYIKESGPGMVLVFRGPDMMEDLRHEMTHAFLHACMHYVPLWLDEGLAEYFEKPRETRAMTNPHFTSVSRKTMFGQIPSIARMERMRYFDQMGNSEYCDAWSWVHFMIHHSRETHQMLAGYIRLLAEHGDRTPSLETYLAKTVPDVKKAYLEHFRNWKIRTDARSTPKLPPPEPETKPKPKPPKESSDSSLTRGWSESIFR